MQFGKIITITVTEGEVGREPEKCRAHLRPVKSAEVASTCAAPAKRNIYVYIYLWVLLKKLGRSAQLFLQQEALCDVVEEAFAPWRGSGGFYLAIALSDSIRPTSLSLRTNCFEAGTAHPTSAPWFVYT